MPDFCHLHNHTQYSLLDGASGIPALMAKAQKEGMEAIAITDHGNMFGAFKFFAEANKFNIKPIIGCEFYLCADRFDKKDRVRYHQLLLAKNEVGYRNLSKLCSLGFLEGYYYHPRIDKKLLMEYKEGLIATTCCLAAEVPRAIINKGEEEAEKVFLEWLDIFGEDYYIELQRHGIKDQDIANEVLIRWSKKHNVKMIATNDSHYVEEDEWEAHDILLCLQTGKDIEDPKRFKFDNNQFYFKTKAEMLEVFKDVPEAIDNTMDIVSKCEAPNLKRDILLPNYTLPDGFNNEDEYLHYLSIEGAKKKYGELNSNVEERINYELGVIKDMGFAGYFLIVQDFIHAAKDLGVSVGPGRGSAAGSAVAFSTGITNIDPIKYNLLFERFLNPERVSMPDIDIDFDDTGRQKVIDYVVDKYGKNQVAQIVTFGTMAAKMAIRDVARVMKLPLPEADKIAKLIPEGPGVTLAKAVAEVPDFAAIKKGNNALAKKTIGFAETLEGSVRHTGIHAAGVIIAPDDITKFIPVCKLKDSELYITQFDGKYIEDAGMLKMDFLGLKTLSIIKEGIKNIKKSKGIEIDIETIPFNDEKTYELFQAGNTVGVFQFESQGMRAYLKELKPTDIEDLIAMNALYRPGPMDYIPEFIKRKHGINQVEYPHEKLEELLKPTYGIMVYQEQIMQTAQIIAGYSLGAADVLRRVMGKKKVEEMQEQKVIFVKGAIEKGIEEKQAQEIFEVMEKFAQYGFNRSHSAAYSVVAYQTAYLKANYPAEYLAAVLTNNMSDIKQVNFFLNECRRLKIKALGPDINESSANFTVNANGNIRFALSAIKGVGDAAVDAVIEEKEKNGPYKNIFDLTKRANLRAVNKKSIESLVQAGVFDFVDSINRAQYFAPSKTENQTIIERAIKFGGAYQNEMNSSQNSLFGDSLLDDTPDPEIPPCEPWNKMEKLQRERAVTGIYISGHPLDEYKLEIENFCTCSNAELDNYKNKDVTVAGVVTAVNHRINKKGNRFGTFTIEDYNSPLHMILFSEDYLKMRHFLVEGELLYIKGRYQLRWKSEDEFELRPSSIQLLSDVREKETKGIVLHVELNSLSDELINKVTSICSEKGKYFLNLNIIDQREKNQIHLSSNKLKLDLNDSFLAFIASNDNLSYKLK